MRASELGCIGLAAQVAAEFEQAYPGVPFTSGLRSLARQAHAMAVNECATPGWIAATYRQSAAKDEALAAVAAVAGCATPLDRQAVANAIFAALDGLTPDELRELSAHFTGEAFDVEPTLCTPDARQWLQFRVEELGGKVLFREGGLDRVHAQFPAT